MSSEATDAALVTLDGDRDRVLAALAAPLLLVLLLLLSLLSLLVVALSLEALLDANLPAEEVVVVLAHTDGECASVGMADGTRVVRMTTGDVRAEGSVPLR